MDTGDDPNAANPRRRNRGSTRVAASRPPALDDAPISTPLPVIHLGYSRFPEWREFLSRSVNVRACEPARHLGSSATRSQASSSAAPPSDHPGSERAGSGTHVRQCVLYSDLPRRTRHRRPTEHVKHPSEGSTGEHGLDLLTIEALSERGLAGFHSDHPGAKRAGSRTHVRQSVLYSDRPRRTRHRRPTEHVEHPSEGSTGENGLDLLTIEALSAIGPAAFRSETEEHRSEVGSSGHGRAVPDLPTLEALSLMNELPLLTTDETSEESDAEDVDEEHIGGLSTLGTITDLPTIEIMSSASDTREPLEESDYDYDEFTSAKSSIINCSLELIVTDRLVSILTDRKVYQDLWCCRLTHIIIVSDDEKEQSKPDSDVDSDEFEREMEEYFAANPCVPLRPAFDKISAIEQATLTAQAAEWGTEPPSAVIARAALEVQRQQETRSLQAPLQASDGAIQRHEASTEDIVRKGERWMCEEVMLCFKKYIERSADLVALEYKLDELCRQCFNVESYNKVFHHYNFRVMMKMPCSVNWTEELYFAEVKQIFGRKYYFCCPLEQDEDGDCYACKNQGVEDLKHPTTGGFDMGSPDAECSLW